jgi:hypothetical protein
MCQELSVGYGPHRISLEDQKVFATPSHRDNSATHASGDGKISHVWNLCLSAGQVAAGRGPRQCIRRCLATRSSTRVWRACVCVCACVCVVVVVVSSDKNFSISTYVATAMSFIHQATVPERGQRFLLATLGDTAGWGIRRYNETLFPYMMASYFCSSNYKLLSVTVWLLIYSYLFIIYYYLLFIYYLFIIIIYLLFIISYRMASYFCSSNYKKLLSVTY